MDIEIDPDKFRDLAKKNDEYFWQTLYPQWEQLVENLGWPLDDEP